MEVALHMVEAAPQGQGDGREEGVGFFSLSHRRKRDAFSTFSSTNAPSSVHTEEAGPDCGDGC